METNKIEQEILENGNRKINIGVRGYPELKLRLSKEAKDLELSLSEHCENILANHQELVNENNIMKEYIEELQQKIYSLENNIPNQDKNVLIKKIDELNHASAAMKNQIDLLKPIQGIISDTRLNHLFTKVKGKSDTILTDTGEMNITFNSPKDVLLALIYYYKY